MMMCGGLVRVMVVVVALCAARVWGQPAFWPASGSVAREGQAVPHGGHGWAVVPESRGDGFLLVYLPPREFTAAGGELAGAPAGTVRVAVRLTEPPEAIAAVGEDVYLVFGPSANGRGAMQRMVYSVAAVAGGLEAWSYMPMDRLRAEDSLPGEGRLVGLAGTPVGPAALIDRGPIESGAGVEMEGGGEAGVPAGRTMPRPGPELTLFVLTGGEWRAIGLPTEVVSGALPAPASDAVTSERTLRRFMLATSADGVALVATRPARRAMLWTARLTLEAVRGPEVERNRLRVEREEAERAAGGSGTQDEAGLTGNGDDELPLEAVRVEWVGSAVVLPSAGERSMVLPTGPMGLMGSALVFAHGEAEGAVGVFVAGRSAGQRVMGLGRDRLRVGARAVAPGEERTEADAGKAAAVIGVVNWVEAGRVGLVLAPASEDGAGSLLDAALRVHVVELSADTGAVVYDGPNTAGVGRAQEQFQALLIVVLGVTALLLVWTIRGGAEKAIRLPEGSALAEPSRRLAAGGIDFLATCCVTGWILGMPLGHALSLRMAIGPEASLAGLGVLMGVGVGLLGLLEGLTGRSLGKVAMGLRVVAVTGRRGGQWGGPGVWRGLARCGIKWVAGPLAILGLSRADGRHLGDELSGTAVVVRVEGEESGPEDAEGD